MAWVRLEDTFPEHPKIQEVEAEAAWLFVQALCYANRNLTDGFIPHRAAKAMGDSRYRRLCGQLVAAKLWETERGGYRIHDYVEYQPTREVVVKKRNEAKERMTGLRLVRANFARTSPEVHQPRPIPSHVDAVRRANAAETQR